jgi:phage protein D
MSGEGGWVKTPTFEVSLAKGGESYDLTLEVTSLTYQDRIHGESDEVSLQFEDRNGWWRGQLFPDKGDTLNVMLGYLREPLLECGDFEIDEIRIQGSVSGGDTAEVKGISAAITSAMRTKESRGFEKQTLPEVVKKLAGKHGLQVQGTVPNLYHKRITQRRESTLKTVRRLAEKYGCIAAVKNGKLVFDKLENYLDKGVDRVIERVGLMAYSLRSKTDQVFRESKVSAHDPDNKEVITEEETDDSITKADTDKSHGRTEDLAQARRKVQASRLATRLEAVEGSVTMVGDPELVAGLKVELKGFGALDGEYLVWESRHSITRGSGYTTELTLKSAKAIAEGAS